MPSSVNGLSLQKNRKTNSEEIPSVRFKTENPLSRCHAPSFVLACTCCLVLAHAYTAAVPSPLQFDGEGRGGGKELKDR